MKTISIRRLKVYYAHYGNSYKRHPVIRLAGHYLDKMNFKIEGKIKITIAQNVIVIRKIHSAENNA